MFAAFSEFYVFFHYGVLPAKYKGQLFVLIEVLRFILFYCLCFYYTDKASGLLKNRNFSKNLLTVFLVFGLFAISIFGIYLGNKVRLYQEGDVADGINPNELCFNLLFNLYRWFSVFLCVAFYAI